MVREIHLEDRQLQNQTQEKRTGDLTLVFSPCILCMTQPTHISLNSVKRTRRSTSRTPPGGRASMQQDTFDRQVTVCNTRSKVRIAKWNMHTSAWETGKHKKEANRMNLDILGLAEVRWLKYRKLLSDEHMLIYSGDIKEHKH